MAGSSSITRFEQAALTLAERGYHVFPCASRDKRPITRNGFKDATRDERKILHWWDKVPDANIGVACGATGLVVLDIDAKHGADPDQVLEDRDTGGAPVVLTGEAPERDQAHPRSLAGTRGAQVFFRGDLKTTSHLTIPGTEIRGTGGYVVVPPSVHPSGVEYTGELPPVTQLPPVPDWLRDAMRPFGTNGNGAGPVAGMIPKGEQHHTLVSLAGSMRRRGMEADEIEAALAVTNAKRLEQPASPADIRRIAESVAKYPPGEAATGARAIQANSGGLVAAIALGELLDLPSVGVKIRAARVYGKGSGATLEIDLSNGETMTFATLRDMMRPQALIAEVAACSGATPALKQVQCAQALTLARTVATLVEIDSENDIAREWGRDFLELAEIYDIDINDQAQRWAAFGRLKERDPWGRHQDPHEAQHRPLVLRHHDGVMYVRTIWFERYVKARDSGMTRPVIGARMARVGWTRRGKHGDIKATAPGRKDVRIWPFWIVPDRWASAEGTTT